ncbi:MAG: cytochrome P450 [Acidimicrobiia bacterium]|nr:cytochrome P450 [Acidimicrobiia bacterium]
MGAVATYARTRDPFRFLEACVARFGDIYSLPLGPGGTTVVNHPELVGSWLTDYDRYHKGVMARALLPALGDGIPISDGDKWRRNRKALNPAFGRRNLDGLAGIIGRSLLDSIQRWDRIAETGHEVELYRELSIMTMQALQRSMFSSSVDDTDCPELVDLFRAQARYMGGLMATFWAPRWVPVPASRRGISAVAEINRRIDDVVGRRRAAPTGDADLLNLLLDIRHEDNGTQLSEAELRDELMGLWFGGFDTTGSALVWALALLAVNPEAAARLREEADAYHGDFTSFADLTSLPYAKAVFDEAQRVQGALLLTRQALVDDEIGGYLITAGSQVGVSAYTLNRNPAVWEHPERFEPERFLGEQRAAHHRHQFVQFGAGPRHCIGSGMAYLEAQFALTMIAQRFEIVTPQGWTPRHEFHMSIGIKGGLPARLRRRKVGA